MVYQAVAEYWANAEEPQYDLKLDILLPTKSDPEKYIFNRGNHYATRTSKVRRHTYNCYLSSYFLCLSSADPCVCIFKHFKIPTDQ